MSHRLLHTGFRKNRSIRYRFECNMFIRIHISRLNLISRQISILNSIRYIFLSRWKDRAFLFPFPLPRNKLTFRLARCQNGNNGIQLSRREIGVGTFSRDFIIVPGKWTFIGGKIGRDIEVGRNEENTDDGSTIAKSFFLFGAGCNPIDFVQCCNVFHQSVNLRQGYSYGLSHQNSPSCPS